MGKFVIYTLDYCEKRGGKLVLHYLCHYLNECGYEAYVWPAYRVRNGLPRLKRTLVNWIKGTWSVAERKTLVCPNLNTPIATRRDLKGAIVVYPEIVAGSPLRSSKVVRWFLHIPGNRSGKIRYGKNELYFHFQRAFRHESYPSQELRFFVQLKEFVRTNFGARSGTCFILRKGKDRPLEHDLDTGTVVDDLSHEEMAKVFNQCECCISYDLYTAYSRYAAFCGCKSIVVPQKGLSIEQWRPDEALRLGVAYGADDLKRAEDTVEEMREMMETDLKTALERVDGFAKRCLEYFAEG